MPFPAYLFIPALAAVVYTIASLCHKRGYEQGAKVLPSFHWANLIGMPFAMPLFFINPQPLPLVELWRPVVVSGLIYLGSWSTFAAIRSGDVSLVTPVLGTKVMFVAAGVVTLSGDSLSTGLWTAAALVTLGVFIMGRSDLRPGAANGLAIGLCLVSSLCFALTDVLISMWVPHFGGNVFLAIIPQFLGLFSLATVLRAREPVLQLTPQTKPWVIGGGLLLAAQGTAMGIALAFFNDPAGVNILYSTRGLWSVVLVWWIGSWFSNRERHHAGRGTMLLRLAGALFITAGVVIAVMERSPQP